MMMIISVHPIAKKGREVAPTLLAIANALAIAITRPVGLDEQMPDAASGYKKKNVIIVEIVCQAAAVRNMD